MNKGRKQILLFSGLAVLIVAVIIVSIIWMGREKETENVKVGFIMSGSMEEIGWNGIHYEGVKAACDNLEVELLVKEDVKEFTGQCKVAIEELVEAGAEMIILSSYGYSEEALETVKEYPEIVFYGNSSEYHEKNMTSYFVRMYQARYLAGIVAGMRTQSNKIGYVAAMENNEVNRGINAFTLGVKRVNPDAEVIVNWTGSWDDEEVEKKSAQDLIDNEKVDLLTYHQNKTYVAEIAEENRIDSIGYHQSLENGSVHFLTAVECNWKQAYEEIIRAFLIGNANSQKNYWIGIEKEVVDLSAYSNFVTDEIQQEVQLAKEEILSGNDVFSGIIYDTEGNLRCGETEFISDEVLLEHSDWFVEGVRIYEDKME